MNVIKFKDQIRPKDKLFNEYLKGKYAYWIRMRYIVPFDFITEKQYIAFENNVDELLCMNIVVWDITVGDIANYVDVEATDSANSTLPFKRNNLFSTDSDITIDEVKKFRRWLAKTLLMFDSNEDGSQKHELYTESFTRVLRYYANDMYDEVVKALMEITPEFGLMTPKLSDCGCGADLSGLYNLQAGMCNPLEMYRRHMYDEMVKHFGDLAFWLDDYSKEFIKEFKAYIDNIISLNLPLRPSPYMSNFTDCPCTGQDDSQENYLAILRRLSITLGYLHDDEVKGHKNYMADAFLDWASILYEYMQWD